jgi:hypothetical protein
MPQTHADYIRDRIQKIDSMLNRANSTPGEQQKFLNDPAGYAQQNGVKLSDEEVYGIKASNGDFTTIRAGLTEPRASTFDNNCGCGGPGTACW